VSVPEQITTADYFRMNTPFTIWLKKKKVWRAVSPQSGI